MRVDSGKGSLVSLIQGIFILVSVMLGFVVSKNFFYFTGFIGLMIGTSSLTGFCPIEIILKALGVEQRNVCKM